MIFEEKNHFLENFFSNNFIILAVDAYSVMQLCTLIWLNHDYGDERIMDIWMVDAYSGVEVGTQIFLGEASNFFLSSKSVSIFLQNSNGHIS
jgi:hypothetical protein